MKRYDANGLPQKLMAMLTGLNQSTISRYVQTHGLSPLPGAAKRNTRFPIPATRQVLNEFIASRHPIAPDKKVHAFYNFKGGTGKTSLCYQVASHLALCGYKVLAIDADPQGHLSTSFGFDHSDNFHTLYDGLVENVAPNHIIKQVYEGLDCIPSNLSLTRAEVKLNELPRREERLAFYIETLRDTYDFIIFDTNPNISHLNRNVLNCSNVLNIVCETHPYSVNGVKLLMDDLMSFFNNMKVALPLITIIPNKYEDRASSSLEAMTALSRYWGEYLIKDFAVRRSEDFPKAARDQLPISFFCKVNSIAFEDITDLVTDIIQRSVPDANNFKLTA